MKDWEHHADKISYVVEHTYEPDFVRTVEDKTILLESKGRFWDHAEYSKYVWVSKRLPEDTELVFYLLIPQHLCQGLREEGTAQRDLMVNGHPLMGLDGLVRSQYLMNGLMYQLKKQKSSKNETVNLIWRWNEI